MWYASISGRQVPLNVTDPKAEAAAWAAYNAVLASQQPPEAQRAASISGLVAAYLNAAEGRVKSHTLKVYRWYLSQFLARFGTEHPGSVAPERIEADARRSNWTNTTRNNYLCTVESCLRWAGLKLRLRKPPKASAGAGSVIPEETYRRMQLYCRGDWAAIIRWLWETGARPSEARSLTVEMVDWEAKVVRLKDHKTAARGGDRLIYLSQAAFEVLTWQRERWKSGLLFRSPQTKGAFTRQAFVMKFNRLSEMVGRRVTAYGLRHTYATRALQAGESDTVVAALLGHRGTAMIHKHYSHVSEMGRALGDAAQRIGKAG